MNFYDPNQYASKSNTLSPLASDETVLELKTVLVYDDASVEVITREIPCGMIEEALYKEDLNFDGDSAYRHLKSELPEELVDGYGFLLAHAVIQVFSVKSSEVRIGEFSACQVFVKTIHMDIHVDEYESFATNERVLVGEGMTLLYTD